MKLSPAHSLLLALATFASAAPVAAAERSFPVSGFEKICVAGSSDVTVVTGQAVSVRAVGDVEDLDRLSITVSGDVLTVSKKPRLMSGWGSDTAKVFVTVPRLTAAALPGSGDLRIDAVAGPAFEASLDGSGDLSIGKATVDRMAVSLNGSGDIRIAGSCGAATISLDGSGDIALGDLRCKAVTVNLDGSGDISAYASEAATASLNGSGDIVVRGGARCTQNKRGSGSITCS